MIHPLAMPPFAAAVGLQLGVAVKAWHGAAAPVMARTTTSAQVRALMGLWRVEGMVPGKFDGIRQVVASTHVAFMLASWISSSMRCARA